MIKILTTVLEDRFNRYDIKIPEDFKFEFIGRPIKQEELKEKIKDADFLFVNSMHEVSREVLLNAPKLKMVHTNGVGFDKIDLKTASELNIPVVNNKAVNDISVAELTICLILEGLRNCATLQRYIYEEDYLKATSKAHSYKHRELYNKTVGLIGLGDIGKQVAKRLNAFGCNILYYKLHKLDNAQEEELNVRYASLEDLLKNSDIVSLHIPSNENTKHIINAKTLALMKEDAILVNTGRGELIDHEALIKALKENKIYGACLDVLEQEPAPKDLPILNLPQELKDKLIITPHLGGNTEETNKKTLEWTIKDFKDYLEGKEIKNIVNKIS